LGEVWSYCFWSESESTFDELLPEKSSRWLERSDHKVLFFFHYKTRWEQDVSTSFPKDELH
jgi:hypothetical protein